MCRKFVHKEQYISLFTFHPTIELRNPVVEDIGGHPGLLVEMVVKSKGRTGFLVESIWFCPLPKEE
jgi:hypothetical protein